MTHKPIFIISILFAIYSKGFSQVEDIKLHAEKVQMYSKYLATRHGGETGLEQFKTENKYAYMQEMWYFTESFYIKRNHSTEGVSINADIVDITRFEQYRKANEEAIVEIPGFKDALILLPTKNLIYKPNY
jgi:hypothetical protein